MPNSAVGHSDVVLMKYKIGMGLYDHGLDALIVSDQTYKEGVSLSEVSWGFNSPGSTNGAEAAKLSFTIHDIAGKMIDTISKLRTGKYWLYFKGPTSTGALWGGDYAIYRPIPEDCRIEFSYSTGFTYTISGVPIVKLVEKSLVLKSNFTITGNNAGPNATFKDYLIKEFQKMYNDTLKETPDKLESAQLKFNKLEGSIMDNPIAPDQVSKDNQGYIAPMEFSQNTPLATAIREFFFGRFFSKEHVKSQTGGQDKGRPNIQVTFDKLKDGFVEVSVIGIDSVEEAQVDTSLSICIGDDANCAGIPYRAELAGIEMPDILYSEMTRIALKREDESGDPAQAGNDTGIVDKGDGKRVINTSDGGEDEAEVSLAFSGDLFMNADGVQSTYAAALTTNKMSGFTVSIELPYSFAFTPDPYGGKLKPAIPGTSGVGIDVTQGANLSMFWYKDSSCSELALVPGISGFYRIVEVTHTIGLSANTTQVKLSHFTLSRS